MWWSTRIVGIGLGLLMAYDRATAQTPVAPWRGPGYTTSVRGGFRGDVGMAVVSDLDAPPAYIRPVSAATTPEPALAGHGPGCATPAPLVPAPYCPQVPLPLPQAPAPPGQPQAPTPQAEQFTQPPA